jgi:hypothetical protein
MSSAPSREEIARDAKWLAQALDPSSGMVRLIAMDGEAYRAASFLDDRMLQGPVDAQIMPWPEVESAVTGDPRSDARWIFHIGHVGSTLLSRLLGEIDGVLALREPRLLRDLAMSPPEVRSHYVATTPKLMSRTFAENQFACVKATSFVSEIAPDLVPSGEIALFMYATPRNYVASILAGENSVKELRMLAGSKAARMAARVGLGADQPGDAHLAACAWACEMTALEDAADRMADRQIAWADFDYMLGDMPAGLRRVAEFFGFSTAAVEAISEGPLMARYSKALEYEYTPALRCDLIAEATEQHRRDIDDALAMLASAAEKSPLLERALKRAAAET